MITSETVKKGKEPHRAWNAPYCFKWRRVRESDGRVPTKYLFSSRRSTAILTPPETLSLGGDTVPWIHGVMTPAGTFLMSPCAS